MKKLLASLPILFLAPACLAQVIDNTPTRVQTTLNPGMPHIGTLVPKHVREISTSRWTLGCETIDREYANARMRWEPLYEVTQMKGDGETLPALSPNDEFANFERWDRGSFGTGVLAVATIWTMSAYGMPRYFGMEFGAKFDF